jgi:hypothetical protein
MSEIEALKPVGRSTLEGYIHSKKALYFKAGALGYYLPKYKSRCVTLNWLLDVIEGTVW